VEVFAHRTAGHTTWNPNISIWESGKVAEFAPTSGSRQWLVDGGDIALALAPSMAGMLVKDGRFSFRAGGVK
jgi:hypothetical protein